MALWWHKLRPGGRMCGDDGAQPSVRQRLKAFLKTNAHGASQAERDRKLGPSGLGGVAWFAHDHWCLTR